MVVFMSIKLQNELIGDHPTTNNIFVDWVNCTDYTCTERKKHRSLLENDVNRKTAIENISLWLIKHHIDEFKLARLEQKKKILDKYGFKSYLEHQNALPTFDKTKKGNCTEVIFSEYLCATSGLQMLVYRLRYNTNPEQSEKGDDILLLNSENLYSKIIVGESKFRQTATSAVVSEVSANFGKKLTLPLSLSFIANELGRSGNEQLASKIEDLLADNYNDKAQIVNVGFILSSKNIAEKVENNMDSDNPGFIIVSLGIDNPEELVNLGFARALEILEKR